MITDLRQLTIPQGDNFYFIILSDLHIGSRTFAEEEFKTACDYILKLSKEKQVIVILNGDIIEAINYKDKRFDWDQVDQNQERYPRNATSAIPQYQCEHAKELLSPIAHLIYYIAEGNHEESLKKYSGSLDCIKYLMDNVLTDKCKNVGYASYLVFPIMFTHRIEDPRNEYHFSMAINHGVGGGMLPGAVLNSAYKLFEAPQADIYVMGHMHHGLNDVCEKYAYNPHKGFYVYNQYYCCVGSFMKKDTEGSMTYANKLKGQAYPVSFTQIEITVGKTKSDCKIVATSQYPNVNNKFSQCERKL